LTKSARPTAQATARGIIARGIVVPGNPDAVAASAEDLFARLCAGLSEWIGSAGCRALFARAVILTVPTHPVLSGVTLGHFAPYLPVLTENASAYGADATVDAAEAVLVSILTMLHGLIGDDIATGLVEEAASAPLDISTASKSNTSHVLRRAGHREADS
jgi:hypothetical protein